MRTLKLTWFQSSLRLVAVLSAISESMNVNLACRLKDTGIPTQMLYFFTPWRILWILHRVIVVELGELFSHSTRQEFISHYVSNISLYNFPWRQRTLHTIYWCVTRVLSLGMIPFLEKWVVAHYLGLKNIWSCCCGSLFRRHQVLIYRRAIISRTYHFLGGICYPCR